MTQKRKLSLFGWKKKKSKLKTKKKEENNKD